MFLKRIELSGFKSFADPTVIQFEEGVTGIVGPNGCGKSNVNDAIRWVLGEQSSKSLRSGSSMSDIIFSGSASRKPVNLARVSLVFDNSQRIFDSDFEEIEITREIRRSSGETVCMINKTPCRLKDITDLVMDTGLGRDSLSIITQGNISSFADSRPEERRLLFEEAAGVARYKKRKKGSLAKLESMQSNLERVSDLIDSLEEQTESLARQAEKAREYIETRDQLASVEVSLLAVRIEQYHEKIQQLRARLDEEKIESLSQAKELEGLDTRAETIRSSLFTLDQQIASMQAQSSSLMEKSYALAKQKVELDEKRKHAMNSDDAAERARSISEMLAEARYELEDRKKRKASLQADMQVLSTRKETLAKELVQKEDAQHTLAAKIQAASNRLIILENRISAPYAHQQGVNAVLKARNTLRGVYGTVSMLLETDLEYAQAINVALGSSNDQIVTEDEAGARRAIEFLKRSRAGRATFLPLSVCRPRSLYEDQQAIASSAPGILGIASEFVRCDGKYINLRQRLLGNILVADTLSHANDAARMLRHKVKVVTLEGDVVHAGGAMSGGSMKNASTSLASLKAELAECKKNLQEYQAGKSKDDAVCDDLRRQLEEIKAQEVQYRIDLEKLETFLSQKQIKLHSLEAEMESLHAPDLHQDEQAADSLVAEISRLHEELDKLNSELSLKRTQRETQAQESERVNARIRQLRRDLSALESGIHEKELEKARLETRQEQSLMRLNSEYSLTWEAAMEQKTEIDPDQADALVSRLRTKLNRLGDVNLQAPEQYDELSQKHEFLVSQKEELIAASKQVLEAINEMDQTMITQFSDMFEKINRELDGIFKAMFSGGSAHLVMCDPQDVLNTGIDIDVQPPGKMVKNIQTFSGGEKALIAISVLFAILRARTMPLCIFDEVEAALDQANVERFARYLSHFKDQSQFVVVTHRPGTMAQCDSLYGITMQQDGVSRVLRVVLKDALESLNEKAA